METEKTESQIDFEPSNKHLADMKESISEIEKTNNFILKRLSQQHEHMDQDNLHFGKVTDALMERIKGLEQKEQEQDKEIKQLMETVMELGENISGMCVSVDTIKTSIAKGSSGRRHRRQRGPMTSEQEKSEELAGELEGKSLVSDQTSNRTSTEVSVSNNPTVAGSLQSRSSRETDEGSEQQSVLVEKQSQQGSQKFESMEMVREQSLNHNDNAFSDRTKDSQNVQNSQNNLEVMNENVQNSQRVPEAGAEGVNGTSLVNDTAGAGGHVTATLDERPSKESVEGLDERPSEESVEGHIVNGIISNEMWNSVVEAEANKAKESCLPCGDGINTVFVVDISDSMKEGGLQQAKDAMNEMIDWMEMVAREESVEENVGVVTFGHITQCRHYLTKDYTSVRECIDGLHAAGSSPLYGGLDMALALFKYDGDAMTLVCNHKILPRIVLLSDGWATDHHKLGGQDDPQSPVEPKVREAVLQFAEGLVERKVPVYCVPIGDNADLSLLTDVAMTTHGQVVSVDDVYRLGRHLSNLTCVMKVRKLLPQEGLDKTILGDVIKTTEKKFSEDNLEDMMAILANPAYQETVNKGFSFEDLNESNPQMPPIGSRVRKGPEWKWKNQDQDGVGTVIGHGSNGWIKVEWDCSNMGEYRYGHNEAFDVVVVEEPRLLRVEQTIETGCVVCRGLDWEYGNQDGGFGMIGSVYHTEPNGQVWVRWPNGHRGRYSYIITGKKDLEVCDPFEVHQIRAQQRASEQTSRENAEVGATGGVLLRSISNSSSSDSSVPDIPPDDEPLEAASMSIYDMMPLPRGAADDEEDEEEEERVLELSLVEAMNKRNEKPVPLPPKRTSESDESSDQSHENMVEVIQGQILPDHDAANGSLSMSVLPNVKVDTPVLPDTPPDTPVQVLPDTPPDTPVQVLPDTPIQLSPDTPSDTPVPIMPDKTADTLVQKLPDGTAHYKTPHTSAKELPDKTPDTPVQVIPEKIPNTLVQVIPEKTPDTPVQALSDKTPDTPVQALSDRTAHYETPGQDLPDTAPDTPIQVSPKKEHSPRSFQEDVPGNILHRSIDGKSISSASSSQDHTAVKNKHFKDNNIAVNVGNNIKQMVGGGQDDPSQIIDEGASDGLGAPLSQSTPDPKALRSLPKSDPVDSGSPRTPVGGKARESVNSNKHQLSKASYSLTEQQGTIVSQPTTESVLGKMASPDTSPGSSLRGQTFSTGADGIRSLSSSLSSVMSASQNDTMSEISIMSSSTRSSSTMTSSVVTWQWEDENHVWHDYTSDQTKMVEKNRKRAAKSTTVIKINGAEYRVVPYKNIQIHTASRATNPIRCIEKSSDVANLGDVES